VAQFLSQKLAQQMKDAGAGEHLERPVAFPHPVTRKPVFCVPDFPHAAKKVVNGLHNKNRNITRTVAGREEVVCLQLFEDVWKFNTTCSRVDDPSGPATAAGQVSLTTDKIAPEYFRKTP